MVAEGEKNILRYDRDGAQLHAAVLDHAADKIIKDALAHLPSDKAGLRLKGISALNNYLSDDGVMCRIARSVLGNQAKPVRAVLFDKTPAMNWNLGWHQDRTVVVQRRVETPGYDNWSIKSGLPHVEPPFDLLASMVTIRIHLDEVTASNAPLLVAPGSHRLGRVVEADIPGVVEKCGKFVCLAAVGDVWLYATPILHASHVAQMPTHRRVLQVDYTAQSLPLGLDWLGI